jgi:hypothetical protein
MCIVLLFVRVERNPFVVMFRICCTITAHSHTHVYFRHHTSRITDSICFCDIFLSFMPSSTDPDQFRNNFLCKIRLGGGSAVLVNSIAYSLLQLTAVFQALAVSPERVMAQYFVAAAHDGNSRAQSLPRLLAYFLLRLFHLHESNIRANSIRLPTCYSPDPSPYAYPAGARDVMACRIHAHSSSAAQELVVAIFMLVDEPTALVLSSALCQAVLWK